MPTATGKSPFRRRFQVVQVAVAAGAASDLAAAIVPVDGTVISVKYVPTTVITGAATNNRTHTLYNRGQAGAGAVVVAQLNYGAGVNAPAKTPKVIPLSGTPANLDVLTNDVLSFESLNIGTGIADPGGLVLVEIARA